MTSPDLQNEKKVAEASHSIVLLKEESSQSHTFFGLRRIEGVIERQDRGDLPIAPSWILIPFILAVLTWHLINMRIWQAPGYIPESEGLLTDMF